MAYSQQRATFGGTGSNKAGPQPLEKSPSYPPVWKDTSISIYLISACSDLSLKLSGYMACLHFDVSSLFSTEPVSPATLINRMWQLLSSQWPCCSSMELSWTREMGNRVKWAGMEKQQRVQWIQAQHHVSLIQNAAMRPVSALFLTENIFTKPCPYWL